MKTLIMKCPKCGRYTMELKCPGVFHRNSFLTAAKVLPSG